MLYAKNKIEEAIVNHAIKLQRMLFGLPTADLQWLAFEIANVRRFHIVLKAKWPEIAGSVGSVTQVWPYAVLNQ